MSGTTVYSHDSDATLQLAMDPPPPVCKRLTALTELQCTTRPIILKIKFFVLTLSQDVSMSNVDLLWSNKPEMTYHSPQPFKRAVCYITWPNLTSFHITALVPVTQSFSPLYLTNPHHSHYLSHSQIFFSPNFHTGTLHRCHLSA